MQETFAVGIIIDEDLITSNVSGSEFLGMSDEVVATQYAYSIFPLARIFPDYSGALRVLVLNSIQMEQVNRLEWRAIAEYGFNNEQGTGGETPQGNTLPYVKINFNIGGGTKRVFKSPNVISNEARTQNIVGPPKPPPETIGEIGLTDNSIEGVDVPSAEFRLQITAYFLPSAVTLAYANILKNLVAGKYNMGSYNNATFLGAPMGEVQFRAASGGGTVVDIIPITFDFAISNNINNAEDEGFPALTMLGHDVLDYTLTEEIDPILDRNMLKPTSRKVHRVASPENYALIGLPV
jgi:hypothetical protein